jgi:hypothetical protein
MAPVRKPREPPQAAADSSGMPNAVRSRGVVRALGGVPIPFEQVAGSRRGQDLPLSTCSRSGPHERLARSAAPNARDDGSFAAREVSSGRVGPLRGTFCRARGWRTCSARTRPPSSAPRAVGSSTPRWPPSRSFCRIEDEAKRCDERERRGKPCRVSQAKLKENDRREQRDHDRCRPDRLSRSMPNAGERSKKGGHARRVPIRVETVPGAVEFRPMQEPFAGRTEDAEIVAREPVSADGEYAWGQDSWSDFEATMKAIKPAVPALSDGSRGCCYALATRLKLGAGFAAGRAADGARGGHGAPSVHGDGLQALRARGAGACEGAERHPDPGEWPSLGRAHELTPTWHTHRVPAARAGESG